MRVLLTQEFVSNNLIFDPLNEQLANTADPDQMPQNAASDQGFHCLQIVQSFYFKNIYKI